MLEYLLGIIKDNPLSYGTVNFLIGALIGHWLAIGRDKRKEFNTIVDQIRPVLLNERNNPSPYVNGLTDIDVLNFKDALPLWKRSSFSATATKYKNSKKEDNRGRGSSGEVYFKDTENIIRSINSLLKFMNKK